MISAGKFDDIRVKVRYLRWSFGELRSFIIEVYKGTRHVATLSWDDYWKVYRRGGVDRETIEAAKDMVWWKINSINSIIEKLAEEADADEITLTLR